MTPPRKRMIHELQLHRKAPSTIEAYVTEVAQLAGHSGSRRESAKLRRGRRPSSR